MSAYLTSIGSALPPFRISQQKLLSFMLNRLPLDKEKAHELELLYRASGIRHRYSVIKAFSDRNDPSLFHSDSPSVDIRLDIYQREALKLAQNAVLNAFHYSQISEKEITHLITVSCTGMEAPGIDIQLIENLSLSTNIERTAINFMGCYGCFNAFKVAKHIVESEPTSKVLIVSVELCSLHLQDKTDPDSLLSNSLFGDGAGAAIIESNPSNCCLKLNTFYNDLVFEGKKDMTWKISEHGFLMTLSQKIPEIIKKNIASFTKALLQKNNLRLQDIDFLAMHPGGKSILRAVEESLNFSEKANKAAHDTLQSYGNMSSATILFVLKKHLEQAKSTDHRKKILSLAFGPGLTIEGGLFTFNVQ